MILIHIPIIVLIIAILILIVAMSLMLEAVNEREKINWHGMAPYMCASAISLAALVGFIICAMIYNAL